MTTTDVQIDDWVVHRPNVVRSVAARVPGVDADEAASRALEKMIRIVNNDGNIEDPAAYWRRAALNEAYSITRESGRAIAVEDTALADITPAVDGAEHDVEREADVSMLRDALSDLNEDDRKLLFDRHVDNMAVNDIAGDLGVRPHAVTMRLRRAEERLAGAFAAAHVRNVNVPECRTTRAGMHDYLKGRLLPRRSKRLEVHMDACADCTRAFVDVREVSWMLREFGQQLVGIFFGGAAVSGAAAIAGATTRKNSPGKQAAVAASVLAALALAGGAAAYLASEPDTQAEAVPEAAPPAPEPEPEAPAPEPEPEAPEPEPETEMPPSIPPQDPQPRDDSLPPLDLPDEEPPVVAAPPAPESAPEPEPAPEPAPEPPPMAEPAEPQPQPETPVSGPGNGQGVGGGNGNGQGNGNGNGNGQGDENANIGNGQNGGNAGGNGNTETAPGGLNNIVGDLGGEIGQGLNNVLGAVGELPGVGELSEILGLGVIDDVGGGLQDTVEGTTSGLQGTVDGAVSGLTDTVGG